MKQMSELNGLLHASISRLESGTNLCARRRLISPLKFCSGMLLHSEICSLGRAEQGVASYLTGGFATKYSCVFFK